MQPSSAAMREVHRVVTSLGAIRFTPAATLSTLQCACYSAQARYLLPNMTQLASQLAMESHTDRRVAPAHLDPLCAQRADSNRTVTAVRCKVG